MFKLPFIVPEEELELNLILVLMIISELNSTSTGRQILDNERLQTNLYLIRNPHVLSKLLILLKKNNISLKSYELSSFKAENNDIETLYDMTLLKQYLKILINKQLVDIYYNPQIGFVYLPAKKAYYILEELSSKYFDRVSIFINSLKQIRSIPLSTINTNLKHILNERS